MNKEDYFKYYIQGSDHYLIPKDVFIELFDEMGNWREEAKELSKKYLNAAADYETTMVEKEQLNSLVNSCQEEIRKLKKQLEELKSTNKVLSEELTKDNILKQDCLTTCCGIPIGDIPKLINQQKEFIDYLENEKDRLIKEFSHYYTDSFDRQHAVNEDMYDEVDKISIKFKEIIGNDINVGSNGDKE